MPSLVADIKGFATLVFFGVLTSLPYSDKMVLRCFVLDSGVRLELLNFAAHDLEQNLVFVGFPQLQQEFISLLLKQLSS